MFFFVAVIGSMLLVAACAAPDGEWSWGSEEKKVDATAEKNDAVGQGARSPRLEASSAIFSENSQEKFQNPLPLETQGRILVKEEHIHTNENAAVDTTRNGRLLGLSNTLCNLGVGSVSI